jgi:hypothetical protein
MTVHFFGTAYSAVEAGQPHVHAARDEWAEHTIVEIVRK